MNRAGQTLTYGSRLKSVPDDGFEYYEHVLLYVDNSLAISHDAMAALDRIYKFFMMKKGSIGSPDL